MVTSQFVSLFRLCQLVSLLGLYWTLTIVWPSNFAHLVLEKPAHFYLYLTSKTRMAQSWDETMRFSKTNQDKMKQVSDKKNFSTSSACFKTTWDGQLEIGVDIFNILC